HAAPAPGHRVGDRKRQGPPAADDRQRAIVRDWGGNRLAHVSSSAAARRTAMVNGRLPERMKATTFATSGSLPHCAATRSSRSRNVPAPKHMAVYDRRIRWVSSLT